MLLHGMDLVAIAALIAVAFSGCYLLLARRMRAALTERELKIADQIAALDNAIRALETRLTDHHQQLLAERSRATTVPEFREIAEQTDASAPGHLVGSETAEEIAPEIQAAIAAAAVATLGPEAVVRSVKPVTSPWTQQGRVLVQGGHNLRVQR